MNEFSSQISSGKSPERRECIVKSVDTPGRLSGSNVNADVQSVTDFFTFSTMTSGSSVMSILPRGSGWDFDIFFTGSRRFFILEEQSSAK